MAESKKVIDAIRTQDQIYPSIIRSLKNGPLEKKDIFEFLCHDLELTEEELLRPNAKGKPKFKNNFDGYFGRIVQFSYVSKHIENGVKLYSLSGKGAEMAVSEKWSELVEDIEKQRKSRAGSNKSSFIQTEESEEEPTVKVDSPLNLIMYGPPGTGKTYNTFKKALEILGEDVDSMDFQKILGVFNNYHEKGRVEFITFHQSYCYEEFIEGIRPKVTSENDKGLDEEVLIRGTIEYELRSGVFKKFCDKASCSETENYVFIIDEINRGNVSRIFGELITLIEEPKRVGNSEGLKIRLPYSQKLFGVPNNVYLIGTMNTADRSLVALDSAIRRRFDFEEMWPQCDILENTEDGIDLRSLLTTINNRISEEYDTDHCIGHAYFIGKKCVSEVAEVFENKIIPLLKEYFYDDLEKILYILADKNGKTSEIVEYKNKRIKTMPIEIGALKRIYS